MYGVLLIWQKVTLNYYSNGHKVLNTHIENGFDFFEYETKLINK